MAILPPSIVRQWACTAGLAVGVAGWSQPPENGTRPFAWSEFDLTYRVDPRSRADMVDFYWTVLARPYPPTEWTGSLQPAVAGTTSERWRRREYSQLNAYRALNFCAPVREEAARLPALQEGALVLALNRRVAHVVDDSWTGVTEAARGALSSSNLASYPSGSAQGVVDQFIFEQGEQNAALVGHRTDLLHRWAMFASIGAARSALAPARDFAILESGPFIYTAGRARGDDFVAWPVPGFTPYALIRPGPINNFGRMRWSFHPTQAPSEIDFSAVAVTATMNGADLPIRDQRYTRGWPITWEFADADLNLASLTTDTTIEITVSRAIIRGQPITFRYLVTLFDETTVTTVGASPRTPLINIATRGRVGRGHEVMIAGFTIEGDSPTRIALRSQGPSLARLGVSEPLIDTRLTLFDARGDVVAENNGWRQHPNWRLLVATGTAPASDQEAGMVVALAPGAYTAVLSGAVPGTGLIEVFNIDSISMSRLANLSTRGTIGAEDNALIAGLVIKDQARLVLIRVQGPSLARFNVSGVEPDPTVRLIAGDGTLVAANDDWAKEPNNLRLNTDLAGLAPFDPREAALLVRLAPGSYTAIAETKGRGGVGLIEVFDLP